MADEELVVSVEADTEKFESALKDLEKHASNFGTTLTDALKSAIASGQSLQDTLRSIALSMAGSFLDEGLMPLQNLLNGVGQNLFASKQPPVTPLAKGGVIRNPTYFPNGNSIGLMGEAGTEAVLPLKRGADGSLGVVANDGSQARSNQIIVNISTPDAASFNRSSPQITAALARAVARGQRSN